MASSDLLKNSLLWSVSQVKVDTPLLELMLLTRDAWSLCSTKYGLTSDFSPITSFLFHPLFPDGLVGQNIKSFFDSLGVQILWNIARDRSFLSNPSNPISLYPIDVIILTYKYVILCEEPYLLIKCQYLLDLNNYAEWAFPLKASPSVLFIDRSVSRDTGKACIHS